jgi:hypothetical protein
VTSFHGPLRRCSANPRYFCDDRGSAIYLTGSHTWANLQDISLAGDAPFDYAAYLDMMERHGHNFMRLWQWMHPTGAPWTGDRVDFDPLPYERSGPGTARDGSPRFDLDRWNEAYFRRLRERVEIAGKRGIYVSVMMFDAWCMRWSTEALDAWCYHPYHEDNNANGLHGGKNRDNVTELYTLGNPRVVERQKQFMSRVVDTVNDLDNVLYEVVNEVPFDPACWSWHCAMVDHIRVHERGMPKQHPVGMTDDGGSHNAALLASDADWISPGAGRNGEYRYDPPCADGGKVILADTDHLWGHGGTPRWAWKSFLRGLNVLFMDPWAPVPGATLAGYPGQSTLNTRDYVDWEPLRKTLGQTRRVALELDLSRTPPRPDLASSGYCLAQTGRRYVAYAPEEAMVSLLLDGPERYAVRWLRVGSDEWTAGTPLSVERPGHVQLVSPVGHDAVVVLERT